VKWAARGGLIAAENWHTDSHAGIGRDRATMEILWKNNGKEVLELVGSPDGER